MEKATFEAGCFWGTDPVRATHDPAKVTYEPLLDVFFTNNDQATLNGQAPEAETLTKAGRIERPIVTIEPLKNFYRVEEYHQRIFEKNGPPSCHVTLP